MLGWLATGAGILAIIVVFGDQSSGMLSDTARVILVTILGLGIILLVILRVVYVLARARNRRSNTAGGVLPDAPRARDAQRITGALLDRLDSSAEQDNAIQRVLLTDRVKLTAATFADIDDRWDALSFIWTVRPSQPAGFSDSPQFHHLPLWAQDAVVLLDLRRDLRLRGAGALSAVTPGFYAHPFERITNAVRRTENTELEDALTRARQTITAQGHAPAAEMRDVTTAVQRINDLLDDDDVWARVVDHPTGRSGDTV